MAKRLKLAQALEILGRLHGRERTAARPEDPLLDHLLVSVLSADADTEKAARAVRALSESFLDLNEARVSPLAELTAVLEPSLGAAAPRAALAARTALQDVFEGTHSLDLEPLRGREPDDLRKFLKDLPRTMGGPAAAVFQLAVGDEHLALSPLENRVLTRLGLLPRAATPARIRAALESHVKAPDRLRFAWVLGSHAGDPCRKIPACEICTLLVHCPFGEQEMKLRAIQRKKDEIKRKLEDRRRLENEAKQARIAARLAAAEAKKKAIADAKAKRIADAAAKKAEAIAKAKKAAEAKAAAIAAKKAEAIRVAKAKAEAAKAKARAKIEAEKTAARAKAEAAKAKQRAKVEAERKKAREKAEAEKAKQRAKAEAARAKAAAKAESDRKKARAKAEAEKAKAKSKALALAKKMKMKMKKKKASKR